jgi:hypothetical protein
MTEYTQDEINAILASIEIDDAEVNKNTWKQKLSESHKGKPGTWLNRTHSEESKSKIGLSGQGRIPWNKNGSMTIESIEKNTDYVYFSPKGRHTSLEEIVELYKDVYTFNNLKYWTTIARNGFSRILKADIGKIEIPEQSKSQLPVYVYKTPKGEFKSLSDVVSAHNGEVSIAQVRGWCNKNKNGFSRTLK